MFTKIRTTRRFAQLRIFSAAVITVMAVGGAMHSASAASRVQAYPVDPQAPAAHSATAATTVVSQAPYNGYVNLRCNVSICTGQLPIVRATEQLVLQFISCTADVSKESVLREFYVQVTDPRVTKQRSFNYLPPTYQSDRLMQTVVYGLGQPITLMVEPNSMVHLGASAIGNFGSARCAVSGVKQTLG